MSGGTHEFKLIIAGGRDFNDPVLMETMFLQLQEERQDDPRPTAIVSGRARGADTLGEQLAKAYDMDCYIFPANWDHYGKRAGYVRNEAMADFADAALIFWDGHSKGTQHMIRSMRKRHKPYRLITY